MEPGREAARREVDRLVQQEGRTRFAARAGMDPKTLGDFLNGNRWSQGPTFSRIEAALGWPPGRIADIAAGGAFQKHSVDERQLLLMSEAKDLSEVDFEMVMRVIARLKASGGGS